ncbi:hypothetical protein RI129_004970 [Pyrocoelia pectoralis]|uniref:Uncharacterized protein n=1 Tax=Pyrocoelia pectoralis TaxID=417401 RepID=A0AAN7ZRR9_9COLE
MSKNSVSYHCDNCIQQKSEINDLRRLILELKTEVERLKLASENQRINSTANADEIITEVAERPRRSRNVIMYNLDDDDNDQDLVKAKDVIKKISNVSTDDIKVFRLGKVRNATKPRPLKIIFMNSDDAINVLRNNPKLKKINQKLVVRSDLTKIQMDHINNLRRDLQERISRGENDITIKYVRGVPRIVKVKN